MAPLSLPLIHHAGGGQRGIVVGRDLVKPGETTLTAMTGLTYARVRLAGVTAMAIMSEIQLSMQSIAPVAIHINQRI